ncbi:unnamed protein product [Adineta steineri]|uniref:Uncharacterized protein n=1 Tax=Adineta steineri TaxID=433720 RepID=A0A819RWN8_9BILA|nr:unnamed protein product [Adineta steineri]CAF4052006.1 unnamed protein product [Adineta steineri]
MVNPQYSDWSSDPVSTTYRNQSSAERIVWTDDDNNNQCGIIGSLLAGIGLAIVLTFWLTPKTTAPETSIVTAPSSSSLSSLSTSISIATSSNTPSTTTSPSSSSSTAASTTTATAVYCASTCTGSFNSSANTTTCSLYCDDGGSYYCRSTSTYCAGQYYDPAGFGFCDPASSRYTGSCNTTDYCCVYDNYYPDYYCLSKVSCGFSG